MTEEQSIANDPSTVASNTESQPRKKTMSEAALAANRDNAKKGTGPKPATANSNPASMP